MRGNPAPTQLRGTNKQRKVWPQAVNPIDSSPLHDFISQPSLAAPHGFGNLVIGPFSSSLGRDSNPRKGAKVRSLPTLSAVPMLSEVRSTPGGLAWSIQRHPSSAAPASPSPNRRQIGNPGGQFVTVSVGVLRRRISSLSAHFRSSPRLQPSRARDMNGTPSYSPSP